MGTTTSSLAAAPTCYSTTVLPTVTPIPVHHEAGSFGRFTHTKQMPEDQRVVVEQCEILKLQPTIEICEEGGITGVAQGPMLWSCKTVTPSGEEITIQGSACNADHPIFKDVGMRVDDSGAALAYAEYVDTVDKLQKTILADIRSPDLGVNQIEIYKRHLATIAAMELGENYAHYRKVHTKSGEMAMFKAVITESIVRTNNFVGSVKSDGPLYSQENQLRLNIAYAHIYASWISKINGLSRSQKSAIHMQLDEWVKHGQRFTVEQFAELNPDEIIEVVKQAINAALPHPKRVFRSEF